VGLKHLIIGIANGAKKKLHPFLQRFKIWSLTLLCSVALFFGACQKDKIQTLESGVKGKLSQALFKTDGSHWSSCLNGVDIVCGNMLSFNDMNHFLSVYNCLESAYEHWNDSVESLHSNLNDDDYNQLWDDNGWDEDIPLIEFENFFNHNSRRSFLASMEEDWMNDPDNMPDMDDHDFFENDVMNTLWSADYKIKIGDKLYYIFSNGRVLEVDNSDCQLLTLMIADSTTHSISARLGGPVIPNPSVKIDPTCWKWGWERNYRVPSNVHNHKEFLYNSKKYATRFKARASNYYLAGTPIWYHSLSTQVKVYRARKNGNGWKKMRTDIAGFGITGKYYDGSNNCDPLNPSNVGSSKGKKRRSKYATSLNNYIPFFWISIKKDEVNASFSLSNLGSHNQLLTLKQ
jgi:hypothetical protein